MVFGVINRAYRARCRFYLGDQRETYIHWREAAPGAAYFVGTTPFHPFRNKWTNLPLDDVACGELDIPHTKLEYPAPTGVGDGSAVEGSARDFAGLSTLPSPVVAPVCAVTYPCVLREAEALGVKVL